MPRKSQINTAIILLLIASLIAACGGEASPVEDPREVPTLRARANSDSAVAPQTSASVPTLAPRSRPAASQPNNDNSPGEAVADTPAENDSGMPFQVADAVPSMPDLEQPGEASNPSLPFNTTADEDNSAPPGFAGDPAEGTEEAPVDTSGPNSDLPFDVSDTGGSSSPESDSGLPFGGGSSTGGSDSGPNSDLPFDIENNSNPFSGGSVPGGGNTGDGLPFGDTGNNGSPFSGGGFTSTVNVIDGRQPVSVFACAETTCDILGQIDPGTEIEVEGNSGQWASIRYQGGTAYVFADFIGNQQVESDGQQIADASPFGDSNAPPMDDGGGGPPFDTNAPPNDNGTTCPPFLPDCNSGPGDNNGPPGNNNPPADSQLDLPTWYTDDNQIPAQPTVTIPDGF